MADNPTNINLPTRSTWEKWLYYNADMFLRHIGTAGLVWAGVSVNHGSIQWKDLWAALLSGAILPTLFTVFQKGLPGTGDGATVSSNSGAGTVTTTVAPPAPDNQPKG